MNLKFLRKYCDRYGEPIAQSFSEYSSHILPRNFQHVLCVPAYDESPDFIAPLLNSIHSDVLVILVLNAPEGDEFLEAQTQTLKCLQQITQSPEQVTFQNWNASVGLLTVDCCTPGRQLPPKEGVGLARKIAGDLAIAAIATQKVESPWIYCTDADVELPTDYFEVLPNKSIKDTAAILYPFIHRPTHDNILQYEISLRYYVLQLERMGSPYAFQTVGSSMAAHAKSYTSVRGFPKRSAAEDFYILNKLAKTGTMIRLQSQPLTLSSRRSHRVPFGTGAAMNRLHEDPVQLLYNPDIFRCIGEWIQQIDLLWNDRAAMQTSGLEHWWSDNPLSSEHILPVLIEQGLPKVLTQAYRQCQDLPHFQFYLHVWFDAFRTLRFIHLMRDRGYPSIKIESLPKAVPELGLVGTTLAEINQELTELENQLPATIGPTHFL